MIESPLIQEIIAESMRAAWVKVLLVILDARFGAVTPTITAGLEQVKEEDKQDRLTDQAATCRSLQAFEEALQGELLAPARASTRGKRGSRRGQRDR